MKLVLAQSCRSCIKCKITRREIGLLSVAGLCLSAHTKAGVSSARIPTDTVMTLRDLPRGSLSREALLGSYRQRRKGGIYFDVMD